jgi:hypothetical protein
MVIQFSIVALGAFIAGEALALGAGMAFSGPNGQHWVLGRNMVWLALDLIGGIILVRSFWWLEMPLPLLWTAGLILLATHSWRSLEYWLKLERAYCFNVPLFIVNIIKVLGLILLVVYLAQHGRIQSPPGQLV